MKRILFLMVLLTSLVGIAHAEKIWFRTTDYAFAKVTNGRYQWGDWIDSDMSICIDTDTGKITIYSPEVQIYRMRDEGSETSDGEGGSVFKCKVIDQDGDYGSIRLRIPRDGKPQLYIDFNNVAWVYNIVISS